MESSTSAVNWQPRNIAKVPGQLRRNTFSHVARGSEGAMFFQWRASAAGAEKFHAGMVPHAGTESRVWREVCSLGADLTRVAEIRGSVVKPEVALLWDWQSWWAVEQNAHPTGDLDYLEQVRSYHAALWHLGFTTDLAQPSADLSRYRVVAVPSLYLVSDPAAENLASYVRGGGTLLVGPFSGIVDESLRIRLGGYPGAFRDLLGVRVEEFSPLPASGSVRLSDGKVGRVWSEHAHLAGAELLASYSSGPLAGFPALTRRPVGDGHAWYLGTCLDDTSLQALLREITDQAGCRPPVPARDGVEVVRRVGPEASYLFVLNHTVEPAVVPARGRELLGEANVEGALTVPPGGVAVVREPR
jgi:beta-galactosidase